MIFKYSTIFAKAKKRTFIHLIIINMKKALFMVALVLSLFACTKETTLTVTTKDVNVSSEANTAEIEFTTNSNWTATASETWCTISPAEGGPEVTKITVTVPEDEVLEARECTITIKAGEDKTEIVNVHQAQTNSIVISKKSFEIDATAQSVSVAVSTNTDIKVTIPEAAKEWISFKELKSMSDKNIIFEIKANETYDDRTAQIAIENTDKDAKDMVIIKQTQAKGIVIEKTEYTASGEGQNIEVAVKSNIEYSVELGDIKWIEVVTTKALSNSTITLKVLENKTPVERVAEITVKGTKDEVSTKLKITQEKGILEYIENGVNYGKAIKLGETYWAPVNCGYEAAEGDNKGYIYGKYYQWGRIDGLGYDASDKIKPKVESTKLEEGKEPESNTYYSYWSVANADNGKAWGVEAPWTTKGAKDPCPEGWRVSTNAELKELVNAGYSQIMDGTHGTSTVKGFFIPADKSGLFIPANGKLYRGYPMERKTGGYLWNAGEITSNKTYALFVKKTGIILQNNICSLAIGVRCVYDNK